MRLTYDYQTDHVMIARKRYHADQLKTFLINNYPALVANCYIKAIRTTTTVFTYDWTEIFRRCETSVLPLDEFINKNKPLKTGGPTVLS